MSGERRPDHLVTRDEVPRWLEDSVVTTPTFHRTSHEAAERIRVEGVSISASRIASFGQGFYTATQADPALGPAELTVAVRLRHPLVGTLDDIADLADGVARLVNPRDPRITPLVAAEIRRHVLDLGYDGIVVQDGGGDGIDYVIALLSASVRVVIDA